MIPFLNQKSAVSFGAIYKTRKINTALKKILELDKFRRTKGKPLSVGMISIEEKAGKKIHFILDKDGLKSLKEKGFNLLKIDPQEFIRFIRRQLKKGSKLFDLDKSI